MSKRNTHSNSTIEKIIHISEGLLGSVTDALLFTIYFGFEASFAGYGRTWKAESSAHKDLEITNFKTIKRAISNLKTKGLITPVKEDNKLPQITEAGKKRLFSKLPFFDSKRIWDKKLYMVTYDIPIKRNNQRNMLRSYLKSIGCGSLQDSVWVTPYNPTKLISAFVKKCGLEDNLIIVSSIGKDGAIGGLNTKELVEKVYKLSEINNEYIEFIEWVGSTNPLRGFVLSKYLKILREDPQIPFDLLPEGWRGDAAYRIFYSSWKDNENKKL